MTSDLEKLCQEKGVKCASKFIGENERDGWRCRSWRVTVRYHGRRLTTDFHQGMALEREPTAADVVSSLCSDAHTVDGQSFEDFCSDFGYDTDSRKAESIYKACRKMAPKVRRLLREDFETFANAEH